MLGEESRLDTCVAILTLERTPFSGSIKLHRFNVNTILAASSAAEPREEAKCVLKIGSVCNKDDVRAIREHMNHHWGGNDLGAPQRSQLIHHTKPGTVTNYLLLISEVILGLFCAPRQR